MTENDILDELIGDEGSEVTNDPADRGGITRYGVTKRALAEYRGMPVETITDDEIRNLTRDQSREVHRELSVNRPGFRAITNEAVRAFAIDTAVLQGEGTAILILQHAVGVTTDGVFGPVSAAALNARTDTQIFMRVLVSHRIHALLDAMMVGVPKDLRESSNLKWRHGWVNRALEFLEYC